MMVMLLRAAATYALSAWLILASTSSASPRVRSQHHHCPTLEGGSFIIDRFQLYPENADWDEERCLLYLSVLFNATVAVYNPYLPNPAVTEIISFPGLTGRSNLSSSGITWDRRTSLLSVILNSPTPFVTGGQDVSGENFLVKYSPAEGRVLWTVNLTAVSGGRYGGFQEVEHDDRGNTYVVGTHPSSIIRVDKHGRHAEPWYPPQTTNTGPRGYSGLASTGDVLIANDNNGGNGGEIHRFDMRDAKGIPAVVKRVPSVFIPDANGIYMPPRYRGTVLLVAINTVGVMVLRSRDAKWRTAEHLGTVANDVAFAGADAIVPAAVQIGPERLYMVELYFAGQIVPGTNAGNRTRYPMVDITEQVEALLD